MPVNVPLENAQVAAIRYFKCFDELVLAGDGHSQN